MKKLLWFCFWFLLFVPGVIAQPSVGLINTETTGPMGIGRQLMEQVYLIEKDITDTIGNADTTCLSNFPLLWYQVEHVNVEAQPKPKTGINSCNILKIAITLLLNIPAVYLFLLPAYNRHLAGFASTAIIQFIIILSFFHSLHYSFF